MWKIGAVGCDSDQTPKDLDGNIIDFSGVETCSKFKRVKSTFCDFLDDQCKPANASSPRRTGNRGRILAFDGGIFFDRLNKNCFPHYGVDPSLC